MNLCIPVLKDEGLQSHVSAHFGSAPMFLLIDTDTNETTVVRNDNAHHEHGMCHPLGILADHPIDAMVVGGIGMGALNKLLAANIRVYQSSLRTVAETLTAFQAGSLPEVDASAACAGHGQGRHGHGHQHGNGPRWGYGRPPTTDRS